MGWEVCEHILTVKLLWFFCVRLFGDPRSEYFCGQIVCAYTEVSVSAWCCWGRVCAGGGGLLSSLYWEERVHMFDTEASLCNGDPGAVCNDLLIVDDPGADVGGGVLHV